MRPRTPLLLLAMPALLAAQGTGLDEGRLDPAWFGPSAAFQPSKELGFLWLKPGLDLSRRSIRLKPWEAPAWLKGPGAPKDRRLLDRLEKVLVPDLARGLKQGLKGRLPLDPERGDLLLVGRVTDAVGESEDSLFASGAGVSFDLKLLDGDTGELLAAFHDSLRSPGAETLPLQYLQWCESLGQQLGGLAAPQTAAPAPAPRLKPSAPASFDLEGALRRIEGLKRDGLLSEAEYQALRKKALARAD